MIVADFFHWSHLGDWRFDPAEWPDPAAMVEELAELGVELMVSIWPSVSPLSENYQEMLERGLLIATEHGPPVHADWADKGVEAHVLVSFYDATNPEARRFVWERARDHCHSLGIRVSWLAGAEADPSLTVRSVEEALREGLVGEPEVDAAVRRVLSIRLRLGELDPPGRDPYGGTTPAAIGAPRHRALAREAARRAIVLLRNEGPLLPLDRRRLRRVAVVGPLADTLFTDWCSGTLPYEITPVRGSASGWGRGWRCGATRGATGSRSGSAARRRRSTCSTGAAASGRCGRCPTGDT